MPGMPISLNQNLATGESGNEEECHIQYLQKGSIGLLDGVMWLELNAI